MGTIFHPARALLRHYLEKYSDTQEGESLRILVPPMNLTVQTRTTIGNELTYSHTTESYAGMKNYHVPLETWKNTHNQMLNQQSHVQYVYQLCLCTYLKIHRKNRRHPIVGSGSFQVDT